MEYKVEFKVDLGNSIDMKGFNLFEFMDDVEHSIIETTLDQFKWNVNAAAKYLGLNRTTLVEKYKRLGIKRPELPVPAVEVPVASL